MTAALGGPITASDVHPGLINLYRGMRDGSVCLDDVPHDEATWSEARTWPDDDPVKAFLGFAGSYAGKWFGGYARSSLKEHPRGLIAPSLDALKAKIARCTEVEFWCADFYEIAPSADVVLYLDPPYAGTCGYAAAPDWDPAAFGARVRDWAALTDVWVSEYAFGAAREVWSKSCTVGAAAGRNTRGTKTRTERLFHLCPGAL